jgi:hypothetical protein
MLVRSLLVILVSHDLKWRGRLEAAFLFLQRLFRLSDPLRLPLPAPALSFGDVHYDSDGATIFKHACALGCEGIVSKRLGSPYRSGAFSAFDEGQEPESASGGT